MRLTQIIKMAMEFPTQDSLRKYLQDHPNANKSLHRVVKNIKKPKEYDNAQHHDKPKEDKTTFTKFPDLPFPMKTNTPNPATPPTPIKITPKKLHKPKNLKHKTRDDRLNIIKHKFPRSHTSPKPFLQPD
jgi:hypothetical protein